MQSHQAKATPLTSLKLLLILIGKKLGSISAGWPNVTAKDQHGNNKNICAENSVGLAIRSDEVTTMLQDKP